MPDFRNLILLRLCAYELLRAFDPNLQNYCFLVSSLTDASPKGLFCFVPAAFIATDAEIPRILVQYAQSLPDRAHDIYQLDDPPIQWNGVADAATIAALQMPGGFGSGDVFPSSVSVARSVAAEFVAARGGSPG